jgi:NADH-quinone oxidoreductase subunit A
MSAYTGVLLFLMVIAGIGLFMIVLTSILGPRRITPEKLSPFECGSESVGDARGRFDVKFYLVALLFIVFDIEAVFLFPWATIFRDLGLLGFVEMTLFVSVLLLGLVYVWRKGALRWEA